MSKRHLSPWVWAMPLLTHRALQMIPNAILVCALDRLQLSDTLSVARFGELKQLAYRKDPQEYAIESSKGISSHFIWRFIGYSKMSTSNTKKYTHRSIYRVDLCANAFSVRTTIAFLFFFNFSFIYFSFYAFNFNRFASSANENHVIDASSIPTNWGSVQCINQWWSLKRTVN